MKTTIEIGDDLLADARRVAAREKTTVRALVEAGLRREIAQRRRKERFRLRDASFGGHGVQDGAPTDWDAQRDMVYHGRGGA